MAAPKHRTAPNVRGKKSTVRTSRGALLARIAALEERVARLEAERGFTQPVHRAATATPPAVPSVKRCPGGYLPMPERPRDRCEFCGFVFAVLGKR